MLCREATAGGTAGNVFINVLQHDCKIALGPGNHSPALDGPASHGRSDKCSHQHLQLYPKLHQNLPFPCKTLNSCLGNVMSSLTDENSLHQCGVCLRPQRSEKAAFQYQPSFPGEPVWGLQQSSSKRLGQQHIVLVAVPV